MEKAREEDIKKHIVPIAPHIMLNSQLTLRVLGLLDYVNYSRKLRTSLTIYLKLEMRR